MALQRSVERARDARTAKGGAAKATENPAPRKPRTTTDDGKPAASGSRRTKAGTDAETDTAAAPVKKSSRRRAS